MYTPGYIVAEGSSVMLGHLHAVLKPEKKTEF